MRDTFNAAFYYFILAANFFAMIVNVILWVYDPDGYPETPYLALVSAVACLAMVHILWIERGPSSGD